LTDELVPIGRVGRPHGLDGSFVVEDASEDERRWVVGATLLVEGGPATVESMRRVGGGRRAIRLDRKVERGATLAVPLSELPPPDPDSYYAFQLVGLDVLEEGGRPLGRVVAVHPGAANDNVELDDGTLVPLIEDAIVAIELDAGRIDVVAGFLPRPATSGNEGVDG
jgi:16S rRNA processing protein RimM